MKGLKVKLKDAGIKCRKLLKLQNSRELNVENKVKVKRFHFMICISKDALSEIPSFSFDIFFGINCRLQSEKPANVILKFICGWDRKTGCY